MEEERSGSSRGSERAQNHSQHQRTTERPRPPHPPPYNASHNQRAVELGIRSDDASSSDQHEDDHLAHSRPEAVTRALRVLQVLFRLVDKVLSAYANSVVIVYYF